MGTQPQVAGWKRVTEAVHGEGGIVFSQLWHAGRSAHTSTTSGQPLTASVNPAYWADPANVVPTSDGPQLPSPHAAMTTADIAMVIEDYRSAARNAQDAGF